MDHTKPRRLGAIGLIYVAVTLGAHCPHTPWGYAPAPAQSDRPQVFFDSGAAVRAHLQNGDVVTGHLLASFAPGSERMVLCEYRRAPCANLDALGARSLPLTTVQRLRFRDTGASMGVDLGFRVGAIVALSHDKENEGLLMLGMLGGAVVGGAIGSRVTRWITVAERSNARQLAWVPEEPVLIPLPPAGHDFATLCARGDSLPTGSIVAVARWTHGAFYTDIRRAWQVDTAARRLLRRRPDGVRCRNPGWPSPGPGAAPDLEAAALTFTPSPGRARIYVYQTNRRKHTDSIGFKIAIDGQIVGWTGNGTYIMAEVDPGPHRVNAPDESDIVVSLDVVPDSVYFLKLRHKIGIKGPAFGGIERMDPVEGRMVIPMAQMAPPEVSGTALTVERLSEGWQLHNASLARIHFLMVERSTADIIEWTPCVGPACLVVPPFSSVRIPDSYVVGHAHAGQGADVVVYWWQTVQASDGTLRADRLRKLIVRF